MCLFHCLSSTLPHSFRVSVSLLSEILPTNFSNSAKNSALSVSCAPSTDVSGYAPELAMLRKDVMEASNVKEQQNSGSFPTRSECSIPRLKNRIYPEQSHTVDRAPQICFLVGLMDLSMNWLLRKFQVLCLSRVIRNLRIQGWIGLFEEAVVNFIPWLDCTLSAQKDRGQGIWAWRPFACSRAFRLFLLFNFFFLVAEAWSQCFHE